MPHATEGELHAYVDGALRALDPGDADRLRAHLERCPDCRAAAEEAREVRDRSASLLEAALGDVGDPPPFESVVAEGRRRGRTGVTPARRGARRLRGWAWAASIVVALGAGWMANAVLGGGDSLRPAAPGPELSTAAAEGARDAATERPRAAAEGTGLLREENAAAARETGGEAASSPAADPVSEVESAAAKAVPGEGTERQQLAQLRGADARSDEAEARAAPASEPEAGRAFADEASRLRDPARAGAGEDPDASLPPAVAWRPSDLPDAAAWLGSPLRRVPELDVVAVEVAELEGRRFARLRQRLPGGETLEILHESRGSTPDRLEARQPAAPPAPEEAEDRAAAALERVAQASAAAVPSRSAWIAAGELRVRLSAPVASDSLAALVLRVR